MPAPLGLLDPNIGILDILPRDGEGHLPDARPLAATAASEAGLDELYPRDEADRRIAEALRPPTGDGSILRPEIFRAELRGCLDILKDSRHPAVRAFVRRDLAPLMEDTDLLNAYAGLMIGG